MSGEAAERVVQYVDGGKWHRVWWADWMVSEKSHVISHTSNRYEPDRHPVEARSEVPAANLCRTCFPSAPSTHAGDPEKEAAEA